jgi:hypothetical protein
MPLQLAREAVGKPAIGEILNETLGFAAIHK